MKKRFLSMLLVLVMVIGMIPFSALTAFAVSSGSGTEGDPLYVTTFAELKDALQSTEDTYIVVEEFKNTTGLSYYDYSYDYENNGFAITIPANYKKHLTVNTTIKLHTSVTNKVCYAFIGNAGNLTIQGTGSISVNFNNGQHMNVPGAIIYNQYPGVLTVNDSVTLNANDLQVTTPLRSNPDVIYNYSGTVNIYGGTFKAYGTSDLTGYERATIAVINRGENAAKINIYGGTFSATNIISSLVNHGIFADDGVKLYGGVFHGIKTDTTLNTLLASDQYNYIDTSDSSVFSPNDSLTETSKILRVRSSTQYNIAVEGGIANVSVACAGDIVTLTAATPPIGKVFDKWEVVSGEIEISGNTFEMPANNVSVKATYKDTPTYTVTFHNGYGSGTMDPVTGVQGEYTLPECSFTAPTRKQFKAWNVGGTEYAVGDKISVTTDVTVTAVWEKIITKITNIDITITEPKVAKNVIDTSMDCSLNTDTLGSTVCYWYESTNGDSWTPLLDGDFKAGKYYKANIYLTRRDYQEYDSNVLVTVNGGIPDSKVIEGYMLIITKVWGPLTMTVDSIELEAAKPAIGSTPSIAKFAFSNTDGVIIKKVQWEYWTSEMGGVFVNMPNDSEFEEGKRYAVLLELKAADGYSFATNKEDMTVYINGQKANLTYNYTNNEFGVELEIVPISTPAFTTQPVGGMVAEGDKLTVNWELNFAPAKFELRYFDNALEESRPTFIDASISSADFAPIADDGSYYQILAYYNNTQYVASNKFYVYEIKTIINTIELQVAKPVIGEAPTKPTIKSVNGDESLKDLVRFFSDSKVYWVEADSAEDIANGNKHPTVFVDGKIYALHVAIQSTKEIAEDCVLKVYGTDGELLWSGNISFSDPSDKTLVYTDAYLGNFKLEIGNVNGDDLVDYFDLQILYQHLSTENK